MTKRARFAVVMSVYNGMRYIEEQIDSILNQAGVDIDLYVRDDGSTDATRIILEKYRSQNSNVFVEYGENFGIRKSFLTALSTVPPDYDYYAFSDADDFWLPRKLISAADYLGEHDAEVPRAYCSQITFVDQELQFLGIGRPLRKPLRLENALVECRLSGATAVLNQPLFKIVSNLDHECAVLHDAWVNLIATAVGQVHFDPRSFILYRQHGHNADGGIHSVNARWRMRLRRGNTLRKYADQARAVRLQLDGQLSKDALDKLDNFLNLVSARAAIRFIASNKVSYQNIKSKYLGCLSLIIGHG